MFKHAKWQGSVEDLEEDDGLLRFLSFQIVNDTHFRREHIEKNSHLYKYNYFRHIKESSNLYYDKVMQLCSRRILKDPMGSDRRVIDIFGYTPDDIMQMDYASFRDLEERLSNIETEHNESMDATAKQLQQEQRKMHQLTE